MKRLLFIALLLAFAASNAFAKSPSLQNSEIERSTKTWKDLMAQYDAVLVNYDESSPKAQELGKKIQLSYTRMRETYSSRYDRCSKTYKKHMDEGVKKGAPMVKDLELEIKNLKIIGGKMKKTMTIDQQKELLKWMDENSLPQKIKEISLEDKWLNDNNIPQTANDSPLENNKPGDKMVKEINGVEFAFRWCPPGSFTMGSRKGDLGHYQREHLHNVTLSKGFWMLETPVTQKQWAAVMHNNPSHIKGDNFPVEMVSWFDCQEFCAKCEKLGLPVCLPSEAQWEYACRAGTTGGFAGNLNDMGWYKGNSNSQIHPVGMKRPNSFNLYDMHGNVWEWCYDAYEWDNRSKTNGDAFIGDKSSHRISRGGSWKEDPNFCRSAFRLERGPDSKGDNLGFRVIIKQE